MENIYNSPKSWIADFIMENGNYENVCKKCGCNFLGHKYRTICKECFVPIENENSENDLSVFNHLKEWKDKIEKENTLEKTDEWSIIYSIPEYKFKNLCVKEVDSFNASDDGKWETTITLSFDNWKEIE